MEKKSVEVKSAFPKSNPIKHCLYVNESLLTSQKIYFWECGTMLSKRKLKNISKRENKQIKHVRKDSRHGKHYTQKTKKQKLYS